MLKHCICHIHCLDHPGVLKVIKALVKYNAIFTGKKIATVTRVVTELDIYERVSSILNKLGYEVITVDNNPLRETGHFFEQSLPKLLKEHQSGMLYYCHSKGITYHPESDNGKASSIWTDVLLHYTLTQHAKLPFTNKKYSVYGSCLIDRKDYLPENIGERFSYAGTFFWLRLEKLTEKTFKPHSKFYLEGLPGLICDLSESFNAGPKIEEGESPYDLSFWNSKGITDGFFN